MRRLDSINGKGKNLQDLETINQKDNPDQINAGTNTVILVNIDPANQQYLEAGVILHGKYRINGVIGQGGFGITYDGTDLNLDMHIAIKEYFPKPIASRYNRHSNDVSCSADTVSLYERGMEYFLKEARNMAKFAGQENFVYVSDYFSENGTAYIIMEFVPGQNLSHYLEEHGRLSITEVITLSIPIMNALEKIHEKQLIHRDISPSNIMILPDGKVKLLDFGAVREISIETQSLSTMSSVYKYGYSPIEQQTRDMKQGPYSDVYALCATIYKMLTGIIPPSPIARLSGDEILLPPSQLGVHISPSQEESLMEGLAIYGADRIQTIGELRSGLCGTYSTSDFKQESPHNNTVKSSVYKLFAAFAVILSVVILINAVKPIKKETSLHSEIIEGQAKKSSNGVEPAEIPSNAVIFNDHSYYLYIPDSGTWDRVLTNCASKGGYPAVINSKEENEFLLKYMKERGEEKAFFGYTDIDEEGVWKWADGKDSDYEDWGVNAGGNQQPDQENKDENWAQLDTQMLNGHWNDSEYGKGTYAYICEWDISPVSSILAPSSEGTTTAEEYSLNKEDDTLLDQNEEQGGSDSSQLPFKYPDGTVEYKGHHYYIYNDNRSSWENAAERCVARGGYMAVINDSEENEFLYKYMISMDFDGAFFGLVRDDSKNWRYLGGDTSDFVDWGVNSKGIKEPNDDDGPSKYASLNIHMNNGHWDDVEYGKQVYTPEGMPYKNLYTYICEWNK